MRKFKLGILTGLFCVIHASFAAECYVTLVKAECWKGYQVDLKITQSDGKEVGSIFIAKDKTWGRTNFPCDAGNVLASDISFAPPIWQNEVGVRYKSNRFWNLPTTEAVKGTIFAINMCFPGEFAKIPEVPNANTSCDCSMEGIPAVENLNIAK